jgi:hypothetical protein
LTNLNLYVLQDFKFFHYHLIDLKLDVVCHFNFFRAHIIYLGFEAFNRFKLFLKFDVFKHVEYFLDHEIYLMDLFRYFKRCLNHVIHLKFDVLIFCFKFLKN